MRPSAATYLALNAARMSANSARCAAAFGADRQPIAVVRSAAHADELLAPPVADVTDRLHHRREMIGEDALIAGHAVDDPRADHTGLGPRWRAVAGGDTRCDVGKGAIAGLRVVDVDQPLGEERRDIHRVRRGRDEDLRVAHPAEALVALRAVGGHAEVVATLAPQDVGEQAVQARIGAFPGADAARVAAEDHASDSVQRRLRRQAGQLDVAEAVEGERRLPDLDPGARADVVIGVARAAHVGHVDRAIRVQHLGEAHLQLRARGGGDLQPDEADQVLAEVASCSG